MNVVNELGRIADDPELAYTQSGIAVAHFDIAVRTKSRDHDAPPKYFPVVAWDKRAEFVKNHLGKGRQIAISGHLDENRWTDKYGQKRKDIVIVADDIDFADLGAPREESQ